MLHQQIHNYKIISLLGEGGMANVYLAENQVLGNQVALKLLKEEFVQHPNIRKRFLAEARNLAQMSHLNVIKVTDLIDAGDIVAFVMEYIEGETLEHYIERKGKLSNEEIDSLFKQMIESVEYVHSQGFIHRDIKPSNFMLTNSGSIKLLDFGIAKNTNDSAVDYTKTGLMQQMGTPMYMSPEQVKNTSEVTKETDVYSLGVVLWQMVTGKKPYDSNTLSLPEIQVAILKESLPLTYSVWDNKIKNFTEKLKQNRNIDNSSKLYNETKLFVESSIEFSKKEKSNFSKKFLFFIFCLLLIILATIIFNSVSQDKIRKSEQTLKSKSNVAIKSSDDSKQTKFNKGEGSDIEKVSDNNIIILANPKEKVSVPESKEKNTVSNKTEVTTDNQLNKSDFEFIIVDNIEVMTSDIGVMNWYDAKKKSQEIGLGWRLPTPQELAAFHNDKRIGGFFGRCYWTSASSDELAFAVELKNMIMTSYKKETIFSVRMVKTIN